MDKRKDRIVSKHYFNSNNIKKIGENYFADFRESIKNVFALRVISLTIKNFATINNSLVYYLVSDLVCSAETVATIDTIPCQVIFSLPNSGLGNLTRSDSSAVFTYIPKQQIHGFKFYLADQTLSRVNPPDPGWSFSFELELIHYNNE